MPVVLVHGFLVGRSAWALFERRLTHAGFKPHCFAYSTRHTPLPKAAEALAEFCSELEVPQLHLIGHSLGGLVILQMLKQGIFSIRHPGELILMGTPVRGAVASRSLAKPALGRWLLGEAHHSLSHTFDRAPNGWSTTVIAGTQALGMGRLFTPIPKPHDGTVAVAETELSGAKIIQVRASHSGLLISKAVTQYVIEVLGHSH